LRRGDGRWTPAAERHQATLSCGFAAPCGSRDRISICPLPDFSVPEEAIVKLFLRRAHGAVRERRRKSPVATQEKNLRIGRKTIYFHPFSDI
jgi:hypothetical protein